MLKSEIGGYRPTMSTIAPPEITAVILAGGQDPINGVDKGLVRLHGLSALEHALAAVKHQVSQVMISANRDPDRYRSYGCTVICDSRSDAKGPLAGVLAALEQASSEYLLTIPCDAAWISPDYAARMYNAARDGAALAAVAHDGNRDQPVFALFARTLLQPLQAFLDRGERRARWFLREQHALEVDFSDCPGMFASLDPIHDNEVEKNKPVRDD